MSNLLIHFCGTGEDTAQHYKKFMGQLKADTMILFSGMGATLQADLEVGSVKDYFVGDHKDPNKGDTDLKFDEGQLSCTATGQFKTVGGDDPDAKNTHWYRLEDNDNDKVVYLIEKKSAVNAQSDGYGGMASRKVAQYALELIATQLADTKFDNITMTGHSRGAAVALPSFLYGLYRTAQGSAPFRRHESGHLQVPDGRRTGQ